MNDQIDYLMETYDIGEEEAEKVLEFQRGTGIAEDEVIELLVERELDMDTAEKVIEIRDELGIDDDEAIELAESGFEIE